MVSTAEPAASGAAEEAQAMEAVVAQFETALLRYATRILRDGYAAQDVVQEVFVKFFSYQRQCRAGVTPPEQPGPWLYRVTHNLAVDHIRHESRRRELHAAEGRTVAPKAQDSQPDRLAREEAVQMALEQLFLLDGYEQQVVLLRVQEGLSYKEISQVTGRTEGNVGCILHNAVKKIAASLKRAGAI